MVSNKVVCEISDKAEALTTGLNNKPGVENLPNMNSSKPIHESLGAGVIKKDLGEIESIWIHINWTLIPPAALHRIEVTESMVKAIRKSVCHPLTSLSPILELNVVFKNIAITANNRIVHYASGRFGKTIL